MPAQEMKHDTQMEPTKLVFIVFDEGILPDVMELLEKRGIAHYTLWSGAEGVGETCAKQGNPVWPGLNDVVMTAIGESAVEPLVNAMHELRDGFPIRPGVRFIITDAVFI